MSSIEEAITRSKGVQQLYAGLMKLHQLRSQDLQDLRTAYNDEKEAHRKLLEELEHLGQAIEVMKKLIGMLSETGMRQLQNLLTYGMTTIFHDKKYQVEIEISEFRNNKTAEFWLLHTRDGVTTRDRLRSSVGGGVVVVVSLILRVYFIASMKLRRFLVLDESLSQLSIKYVEGLFKFLRTLTQDMGFKILFVTHDPRFLEYGDRIYRVKNGCASLWVKAQ